MLLRVQGFTLGLVVLAAYLAVILVLSVAAQPFALTVARDTLLLQTEAASATQPVKTVFLFQATPVLCAAIRLARLPALTVQSDFLLILQDRV